MNNVSETMEQHSQPPQELEIIELGKAKQLTRGTALLTPMLEMGFPPYNHWLPPG